MDLRITTATGTDTVTTTVDGRRIVREEKWSIYVIEGIPGVGPHEPTSIQENDEEGWSALERVAAGMALVGLVLYGWYVPSTETQK